MPPASRRPVGSSVFTTARRACSGVKRRRLRLEVRLHVPMEVQVVLRQVGEDRHVEHDAVDPMLVERVRRDLQRRRLRRLHPASGTAAGGGPAPPAWSARAGPGVRRCCAPVVPTTPVAQTGCPEDRRQDVRDGGLPVRTGDPDRRHGRGRIAERHRRHRPHRPANRRHEHLGCVHVEPSLHDERGGAGVERQGRERVSVDVPPGDAEEEGAGHDLPRVEREVGDEDGGVASGRRSRNGGHQVRERHRGEGGCHRLRAYPRPRSRVGRGHDRPSTWGGGATGGAVGMPRRWIAYRATCWNSGAAATPP